MNVVHILNPRGPIGSVVSLELHTFRSSAAPAAAAAQGLASDDEAVDNAEPGNKNQSKEGSDPERIVDIQPQIGAEISIDQVFMAPVGGEDEGDSPGLEQPGKRPPNSVSINQDRSDSAPDSSRQNVTKESLAFEKEESVDGGVEGDESARTLETRVDCVGQEIAPQSAAAAFVIVEDTADMFSFDLSCFSGRVIVRCQKRATNNQGVSPFLLEAASAAEAAQVAAQPAKKQRATRKLPVRRAKDPVKKAVSTKKVPSANRSSADAASRGGVRSKLLDKAKRKSAPSVAAKDATKRKLDEAHAVVGSGARKGDNSQPPRKKARTAANEATPGTTDDGGESESTSSDALQANTLNEEGRRELNTRKELPTSIVGNVAKGGEGAIIEEAVKQGLGRMCAREGCNAAVNPKTRSQFCKDHAHRRCQFVGGCDKKPNKWSGVYCAAHRVCSEPGCDRIAKSGEKGVCILHGAAVMCQADNCKSQAQRPGVFCVKHGGGYRCHFDQCQRSAAGTTGFCRTHGGGKRCTFEGCGKAAINSNDKTISFLLCRTHGGGFRCQFQDNGGVVCNAKAAYSAEGNYVCTLHGGGAGGKRCCETQGCDNPAARGKPTCFEHGGGQRCQFPEGCNNHAVASKGDEGGLMLCLKHGGRRDFSNRKPPRCRQDGCEELAVGRTGRCSNHGGGRQCEVEACSRIACPDDTVCRTHGGGDKRRCLFDECQRAAKLPSPFCVQHGGGNRCQEQDCDALRFGSESFCALHAGIALCSVENCRQVAKVGSVCTKHSVGSRCEYKDCKTWSKKQFCKWHGPNVRRCQQNGCDKAVTTRVDYCSQHRKCQVEGCKQVAVGRTGLCPPHSRRCQHEGCQAGADSTLFCYQHGGGTRRCLHPGGCTRPSRRDGKLQRCIQHGGGPRCQHADCDRPAEGKEFCRAHGGGKRCQADGCTKCAISKDIFCAQHGGGILCKVDGCTKRALNSGLRLYCMRHGGGKRCQADGCSKAACNNGPTAYEKIHCRVHGGGWKCLAIDEHGIACTKRAVPPSKDRCSAHGGGYRCKTEGCTNGAIDKKHCMRHGGGKRCSAGGCPNGAQSGKKYCKSHVAQEAEAELAVEDSD